MKTAYENYACASRPHIYAFWPPSVCVNIVFIAHDVMNGVLICLCAENVNQTAFERCDVHGGGGGEPSANPKPLAAGMLRMRWQLSKSAWLRLRENVASGFNARQCF